MPDHVRGGHSGLIIRLIELILSAVFEREDIVKDGSLYLRRWKLRKRADGSGIYIHRIVRSDDDRDPHTHPWRFTTFILAGGYTDETWTWCEECADRHKYLLANLRPLRLYRRTASHMHRVRLHEDGLGGRIEAWTLVFLGQHEAEWGFYVSGRGFVHWRDYLHE